MGLKKISSRGGTGSAAAPREKVLYVEDEDTNWEVAELSLRGRYDLVRARNARECFEMLKKHKYELVLMDIQLSGSELDGVQITNILKGLYQEEAPEFTSGVRLQGAPIVFMTAYAARYSKAELLEAGGDELVTKPVDFAGPWWCLASWSRTHLSVHQPSGEQSPVLRRISREGLKSDRRLKSVGKRP